MAKVLSALLWAIVFCVTLLILDQLFVHVPMTMSGFAESRRFYLDFRQRLLTLRDPVPAPSIEAIIDQNVTATPALPTAATTPAPARRDEQHANQPVQMPAAKATPPAVAGATATVAPLPTAARKSPTASTGKTTGYVYADAQGELHFVDRLDQVPARYRREAQSLGN